MEFEVAFSEQGAGYHFHVPCFAAWELECRDAQAEAARLERADGPIWGDLRAAIDGPTMLTRESETTPFDRRDA
jgi:hypothetical protein